jgi:hypothetical protein
LRREVLQISNIDLFFQRGNHQGAFEEISAVYSESQNARK